MHLTVHHSADIDSLKLQYLPNLMAHLRGMCYGSSARVHAIAGMFLRFYTLVEYESHAIYMPLYGGLGVLHVGWARGSPG